MDHTEERKVEFSLSSLSLFPLALFKGERDGLFNKIDKEEYDNLLAKPFQIFQIIGYVLGNLTSHIKELSSLDRIWFLPATILLALPLAYEESFELYGRLAYAKSESGAGMAADSVGNEDPAKPEGGAGLAADSVGNEDPAKSEGGAGLAADPARHSVRSEWYKFYAAASVCAFPFLLTYHTLGCSLAGIKNIYLGFLVDVGSAELCPPR